MCARRLQIYAAQIGFSTAKTTGYRFKYTSHMIPHPAKAYKGGEDAIFTSDNVLVVADGVGGWADHGIDPGLYSKMLCKLIGEKVKKNLTKYIDNPQQLLSEAVSENRQLGSTTVCMLLLNPETGVLKSYYLGDSVYGIFREGEVEMLPEQQKSFNFPFQIGSTGDDPSEGVLSQYKEGSFKETDLIVMGSDGIWDNYDVAEIYQVVKQNPFEKSAEMVAKNAFKKSLMDNYESPFYKRAKEVGIRFEKSGKPDDISVIVSKIVKEEL